MMGMREQWRVMGMRGMRGQWKVTGMRMEDDEDEGMMESDVDEEG